MNSQTSQWQSQLREEIASEQVEKLGLSPLEHFFPRNGIIIASSNAPVDIIFYLLSKYVQQRSQNCISVFYW